MFLSSLVRWRSADIQVKLYGDRPREPLCLGACRCMTVVVLLVRCKVTTKKVARKSHQKIESEGDDDTTTTKKSRQKLRADCCSSGASCRLAPALVLQ